MCSLGARKERGEDVATEGCLSFLKSEDFIPFSISIAFNLSGTALIF